MRIKRARPKSYANFGEIGRSGLNHWGGEIREEYLRELRGKEGRKIIREMMDNNPIIGAILFAVSMLIRQAKPHVKPPVVEGQTQPSEPDETTKFVQSCFHDMSETWSDTVSEILTMLPYGWAWLETVYKKRNGPNRDPSQNSRYTDGRIGWRKMPLRAQDTLKKWVIDDTGGIQGMVQQVQGGLEVTIPIVKSLLFRTTHNKNNPEGRSILRPMYRPWFYQKRIEEIEGIGIERDLAGLPVITAPEEFDIWNDDDPLAKRARTEAETIVRSIRRDEQEGVLLPGGWTLELLASAGKRNFDTSQVIGRYSNMMAMSVLADFIVLGHNNRYGSFALSSNKTHMFAVALGGWLDAIAGVFNRYAIPRLLEINGLPTENPPELTFEDIELPDLNELGNYIYKLSQSGFALFPNPPIERKLLQAASLPTEGVELGREPEPVEGDEDAESEPESEPASSGSRQRKAANTEDSRRRVFRIKRASKLH